ncbi:hypothetical protein EIP91_003697 [Steccherinum ochraceum]|uniref:Sodium/calcium exchanger membrane region domain-containing protein n=1 Tax=Steccherinum ochraceum TaxID=92696 RepID=A0A4R0RRC6_9APHY|nr:hypothetical protein EIP91_003697 [Steccherinum ochraceum]
MASLSEKATADTPPNGNNSTPNMSNVERGYAGEGRDSDVELQRLRSRSPAPSELSGTADHDDESLPHHQQHSRARDFYNDALSREKLFWDRLRGKGKRHVGWVESGKNALFSSWVNVFVVAIPIAWVAHFLPGTFSHEATFALCFLAIVPLEAMFDWGGEQMSIYLGQTLGDLLVITLNNAVEAALAIILLIHCELRLLQSTIVGVIILHLLLIPGTAFLAGGARVWEQTLHPHNTQLNHSLLTIGVLSLLLPTAFFAALDRGPVAFNAEGEASFENSPLVNDFTRGEMLKMSRGFAFILGVVYIGSRIYLANPPGDDNALEVLPDVPAAIKQAEEELKEDEPEMNPLACALLLGVTVALTAVTAEFLVESIEFVREQSGIQEEWFGLILLPIVSFSADGMVALVFFVQSTIMHILGKKILIPSILARARAIDLSIQFTLWWMPFLVVLGWMIGSPMILLFDFFELAILLGACFLVNYITADSKTNWVEGLILVSFYAMIATSAWFYVGQPELEVMLTCPGTVAAAILSEAAGAGGEGGGEGAVEAVLGHH